MFAAARSPRPSVRFRTLLLLVVVLPGCAAPAKDGGGAVTDSETGAGDPGPCADGSWGLITEPDGAIQVRADGDDGGDGTVGAPLATVEAALDLSRSGGTGRIAVGPGTWATNLVISGLDGEATGDDGLVLQGCGAGETIFEAAENRASVLQASGVDGLELAGFTVRGGLRTVRIDQGGTATLTSMSVEEGTRSGVVIDGSYVRPEVHAVDLAVSGISADSDGSFGYGICVQDALLDVSSGGVTDAVGVGVFVTGLSSNVTLTDFTVTGVVAGSDGRLGRGVHVQELALAALSGVTLSGNVDAGLYALRAQSVAIDASTVEATEAGLLEDGTLSSGDGIVVSQGAEAHYPVSDFVAVLTGSTVTASDRAGVLLDGVTGSASGNDVSGNGYAEPGILAQNGADTSGSADPVTELATPLSTNASALLPDDLVDGG